MGYGLVEPKTDVHVRLTGCQDAFQILSRIEKSLKHAGYEELSRQYMMEATSADFDHLMITTLQYVEVESDRLDQGTLHGRKSPSQASQKHLTNSTECNKRKGK